MPSHLHDENGDGCGSTDGCWRMLLCTYFAGGDDFFLDLLFGFFSCGSSDSDHDGGDLFGFFSFGSSDSDNDGGDARVLLSFLELPTTGRSTGGGENDKAISPSMNKYSIIIVCCHKQLEPSALEMYQKTDAITTITPLK